jgi:D-cysteine desulfhydrase family pyridoxal phosphate-dependent enzyme
MTVRALDALPRAGLGQWPTPLDRADRLRDALGGPSACPEIWIKREDLSGVGLGGNKIRKLDVLLGQALLDGVTSVVTTGAWQSNHARETAACCARLGLSCDLVLIPLVAREDSLYRESGNALLDRLFGATVHEAVDAETYNSLLEDLCSRPNTLLIPAGGSNALGTLGYVAATVEWVSQSRDLGMRVDVVMCAVATGGTYAGTLTGLKRAGSATMALGVCVVTKARETGEIVTPLLREAAAELGIGPVSTDLIELTDEFVGAGYGIPTPETIEAIGLFARSEGLVLDPVYSGKAGAALVGLVRRGELTPDQRVVFIHTGGAPSIFAYGPDVVAPL